jgi:tetratricopeptide (TPR) repeat protein
MNKLSLALNDANMAIKLNPKWAKAHRRRASVLDAMKRWDEAKEAYKKALEVGLEEAKGPQEKEAVEGEILKLVRGGFWDMEGDVGV